MCIISKIFDKTELKTLSKKQLDMLQKQGKRLVDTTPEIRNIIKKDPKIQKKLRSLLRPGLERMKGA